MSPKITIVGSTGKLGSLLLKYLKKNNIKIDTHACYKIKLNYLSKNLYIKLETHLFLATISLTLNSNYFYKIK